MVEQTHTLHLKIDPSAAKTGAADFTAAIKSVKVAVRDLAKDSEGAFVRLKNQKPQFDVTPLNRGSAAARDLATAMDQAGRASTTTGTASQRASLAAAVAMRQASTSAQKLAFRLGDLGQTAALDQLDAALDRLHAQLRAAPDLQGVRVARSAYEDLRTELTQAATAAEYAKGDIAQLAREQATAAQNAARHSAALDGLRVEFNPLFAASKQYESTLERIALAEKEGVISATLAASARTKAAATLAGMGQVGRAASNVGWQVQNASYQVGDFFVQVAAGTPATRALAMQLPQLLGGFGMWGAAAGAVAAIMGALLPVLMAGGEKARSFDDVVSDLNSTLTTYRDSAAAVNGGTLALREEFGLAAESAQKFQAAMAAVSAMKMEQQLRDGVASLATSLGGVSELMAQWDNATYLPAALRPETLQLTQDAVARLQDEFGLTLNQAHSLTEALSSAKLARGPEATSAAMQRVVAVLLAAHEAGAKLPPELVKSVEEASTLGLTADRLAAILAPMPSMIGQATGQTNAWASSMAGVRSEVEALLSSLSAISGGVVSNASKRAELTALQAGKSVKQAAIDRERYDFEQRMTAQTNSANAKGGVAGWLEAQAVAMQRYQFNEGLSLDAQLDSSREAARKRDTASAGGGGARSAALKAESASIIELNAQMQTRIASMGRENAALQLLATGQAKTKDGAELMAAAMVANGGTLDAATASTVRLYEAQVKLQERLEAQVSNTTAESMKRLGDSAAQTLQDSLQNVFMTGDFNFSGMVDSLRGALAETLAQQTSQMIIQFLTGIAGGMGGGGGGLLGFVGSIFGFSEGGYSDRPGMTKHMVSPAAFHNAPQYKSGTPNTSGIPAILHPNEAVVPLTRGRKIPVDASGLQIGRGGDVVSIAPTWGDINVTVQSSGDLSDPKESAQVATHLAELVKLKIQEQLAEQGSYGGILNPRGGR